ncbi:MAG: hypothetical protein Q4G34_11695, partial [Micrococcus sp.]|nr:hypothetical protein [Micrococcus sp.]
MSSPLPAPSPASAHRAHRRLPVRRWAALSLAGALVLSGCTWGSNDDAAAPTSSAPTVSEPLPSIAMDPFTVEVPQLDLDLIPGAREYVSSDDDHSVAWFTIPGAQAWTGAMEDAVTEAVDLFHNDESAAQRRLAVLPTLAVAGRSIGAVRLLGTESRDGEDRSWVRVIWYDAAAEEVVETSTLFTGDGWEAFRAEAGSRLQADPEVNEDRLREAIENPTATEHEHMWDGLVFLEDGSALLEIDQGLISPLEAGVLSIRIPADTVEEWLSDSGRRAQDAATNTEQMAIEESAPTTSAPAPAPAVAAEPPATVEK